MLRTYTVEEIGNYGVIYLLTSPSGKRYVGQTWDVKKRWYFYKKLHAKCQTKLYNALIKHRPENFNYEILDLCETQGEMDSKEIMYIEMFNSQTDGYNLKTGGSKGLHSKETINKIKLSAMKNKKKMSRLHSGCKNPNYGRLHTLKSKASMSATRKQTSRLRKNKYLYTLQNGQKTFIIKNLSNFCKSIDIKASYIRHVIYGNMKHYRGWTAKRELLTDENKNRAQDNSLYPN